MRLISAECMAQHWTLKPYTTCCQKSDHTLPLSQLMLGEGLFCVLRLLFCGSIGSIAITKVYLLAHLVVIAVLIHVAKLFPDVIHHSLHRRMFLNVQLLFGDGYFLRELVFWMPAVVSSSVYHHSGRVEYVPISGYESQCFIESSAVSFPIRNYIKLMRHLRHLSVRSASSLMRSSSFPLRPTVLSTRHDGSVRPSDGWNGPRFPRPVRHPRPLT